ncbi:MAG: dephospho-CoA kinase [Erysipelothrix sp.]
MKIAITGTIGGGKSQVGKYLTELGYSVYDTDKMAHTYYKKGNPLYESLIEKFGEDILDVNFEIDRKKMAFYVFSNRSMLMWLESQVFPLVTQDIQAVNTESIVFFEVPLLFEAKMEALFDKIWMVSAPYDLRIKRLSKRGLNQREADQRMKRHLDENEKILKSDVFINNNSTLDNLHQTINDLLKEMEEMNEKI